MIRRLILQPKRFLKLQNIVQRCCQSSPVIINETSVSLLDKKDPSIKFLGVSDALRLKPSPDVIIVQGWVKRVRKFKDVLFVDIHDHVNKQHLQVVIPRDFVDCHLAVGSSVVFQGVLHACDSSRKQNMELQSSHCKVFGEVDRGILEYDVHKPFVQWPILRQNLHFRHLVSNMKNVLLLRSGVVSSVYEYMNTHGFTNITTPIITGNDCEGGGQVFEVVSHQDLDDKDISHSETQEAIQEETLENDEQSPLPSSSPKSIKFFGREAFLTVSGQLHLEAMVNVFPKVFTFSPAFRAEKQLSRRHVSEFTMIEVEHAFIHNLDDLMDSAENFVRFLANKVKERHREELESLLQHPRDARFKYKVIDRLTSDKKYIRITYDDALQIIDTQAKKTGSDIKKMTFGEDLKRFHEKLIMDYFEGYPVFVTHYPSELKAFYMKRDGNRCLNFDLLVDVGGEVIGGSLREDDYAVLKERIESLHGEKHSLDWYLNLRKLGLPPHGGYGLGLDRLIMAMTEVGNIRDVMPFPRWTRQLKL